LIVIKPKPPWNSEVVGKALSWMKSVKGPRGESHEVLIVFDIVLDEEVSI